MRFVPMIVTLLVLPHGVAAAEHYGQVTFGTLPVPGATVTAKQGESEFVTITDAQGVYRFSEVGQSASAQPVS